MTRTSNALALLLLGVLLLIGFLLMLLPSGTARSTASVRSTEEDGRRALYLLLEELGYQVSGWNQAPGNLPRGTDVLLKGIARAGQLASPTAVGVPGTEGTSGIIGEVVSAFAKEGAKAAFAP